MYMPLNEPHFAQGELGSGSYGKVHLVQNRQDKSEAAAKIAELENVDGIEAFRSEINILVCVCVCACVSVCQSVYLSVCQFLCGCVYTHMHCYMHVRVDVCVVDKHCFVGLAQATCRHPNICGFLQAYYSNNKLWIVIEKCDGGALVSFISAQNSRSCCCCVSTCSCLQYLSLCM